MSDGPTLHEALIIKTYSGSITQINMTSAYRVTIFSKFTCFSKKKAFCFCKNFLHNLPKRVQNYTTHLYFFWKRLKPTRVYPRGQEPQLEFYRRGRVGGPPLGSGLHGQLQKL